VEDELEEQPRSHSTLPWLVALLGLALTLAAYARRLDSGLADHLALYAARDDAADLRRTLRHVQVRLEHTESERASKAKVADALEAALAKKGAEAEEREKLMASLKAQLDAKDGEVEGDRDHISVNLVDEILFPSGEAELQPRGKEVLSRVGGVLKGLTDKQILIGGHTDDRRIHTDRFPSNWELSTARAVHVARYLQDIVGVDPHNLTAAGYSEFHPRSNERAKNRRIELLLTPRVAAPKR
jgi:flagellar motor protein MotB